MSNQPEFVELHLHLRRLAATSTALLGGCRDGDGRLTQPVSPLFADFVAQMDALVEEWRGWRRGEQVQKPPQTTKELAGNAEKP